MEQAVITIEMLRGMTPKQMVEHDFTKGKFISLYNQINKAGGEAFYAQQAYYFLRTLEESSGLDGCTTISLYGCFIDLAVNGLSLDNTGKPLLYIVPRNVNVGTKERPSWEKRAQNRISPYGELIQRQKAGQIKNVDNPIIVYEGDKFGIRLNEKGEKQITYEALIPRASNKIIAGFLRITRRDGSIDFKYMLEDDIKRLQAYSQKANRTAGANDLYTSNNGQIDTGFFEAKLIRHAFKTYPKLQVGSFTALETEVTEKEEIAAIPDYGIPQDAIQEQGQEEHFAGPALTPEVVKVQTNDQEGF